MVTFHAVCYAHHRHNDGTFPVKIKVYFKGKSVHLPTNLVAHPSDLTRTLHLKSPQIIAAANELIDQMRGAISDLTYFDLQERDCEWIVGHIRRKLTESHFRLNFIEWCESIDKDRGKVTALNAWKAFGKGDIDINDITSSLLMEFVGYINGRPSVRRRNTAALTYLKALGVMYRMAKDRYNDEDSGTILIPKSPFQRVHIKAAPAEGQKNIGVEIIQRLIDAKEEGQMQFAIDMFLISFALMGANYMDLRGFCERDGWWVYNRSKTKDRRADKAQMKVRIPDCIRERIERVTFAKYADVHTASAMVNRYLARWCRREGVEVFTFYAARHSWASIARSIGIEKATIDECLAHIGDYQIADIYAERNWGAINGANTQVLALFEW